MGTLWHDTRYGLRMLVKSPSVSIVATIALVLGIGANTAIFSVVNAVILRPLPFLNSDSLMSVFETDRTAFARGHARVLHPGVARDPGRSARSAELRVTVLKTF